MANEITIGGSLAIVKAGQNPAKLIGTEKKDMAGEHYIQRVDTIGTIAEYVSKGDIVVLGYCAFKNVGQAGEIRIAGASGAYVASLSPGEFVGPIKWSTNEIYAISDTVGSLLEMLLIEV